MDHFLPSNLLPTFRAVLVIPNDQRFQLLCSSSKALFHVCVSSYFAKPRRETLAHDDAYWCRNQMDVKTRTCFLLSVYSKVEKTILENADDWLLAYKTVFIAAKDVSKTRSRRLVR